jgi:hypothetical protein
MRNTSLLIWCTEGCIIDGGISYFLGRITSRSSLLGGEKRVVHLDLCIRSGSRTWLCLGGNRLNPIRVVVSYIGGGVGLISHGYNVSGTSGQFAE